MSSILPVLACPDFRPNQLFTGIAGLINETAIAISRRRPIRTYTRAVHANAVRSSLLVLGV